MDFLLPTLVVAGVAVYAINQLNKPVVAIQSAVGAVDGIGMIIGKSSGSLAGVLPKPSGGFETRQFVNDYNEGWAEPQQVQRVIRQAPSSFETSTNDPMPPPPISDYNQDRGAGIEAFFDGGLPPVEKVMSDGNPAPKAIGLKSSFGMIGGSILGGIQGMSGVEADIQSIKAGSPEMGSVAKMGMISSGSIGGMAGIFY